MKQYLDVDINGQITLTNKINLDAILKHCYEERNDTYATKGFTEKKSMRKVCDIPAFLFGQEPLLREFVRSIHKDPIYAKKCLRLWLRLNPLYKTNGGSI